MKLLDCALLSIALGLSLFTIYVLSGGDRETVPGVPGPSGPEFKWVVLHRTPGCPSLRSVSGAHFLITAEGEIHSTIRWREGTHSKSTSSPRVNSGAVVVAVEPSSRSDVQVASLRELVCRLKNRYPGFSSKVILHEQVDPCSCGRVFRAPPLQAHRPRLQ